MAIKIAQALEVSLDYLAGNTDVELDKNMLDRIQEVTRMNDKDKEHIFVTLDALIRDFKKINRLTINKLYTAKHSRL
jgi:hypothetical protein